MQSWTALDWIDGFLANLTANTDLAGVTVAGAPVPQDRVQRDHVVIVGVQPGVEEVADIGPSTGSRTHREKYTVVGVCLARVLGGGDDIATAARQRAGVLFAEVEDAVRTTPAMGVNLGVGQDNPIVNAHVSAKTLEQGIDDKYRWCSIVFGVDITARM